MFGRVVGQARCERHRNTYDVKHTHARSHADKRLAPRYTGESAQRGERFSEVCAASSKLSEAQLEICSARLGTVALWALSLLFSICASSCFYVLILSFVSLYIIFLAPPSLCVCMCRYQKKACRCVPVCDSYSPENVFWSPFLWHCCGAPLSSPNKDRAPLLFADALSVAYCRFGVFQGGRPPFKLASALLMMSTLCLPVISLTYPSPLPFLFLTTFLCSIPAPHLSHPLTL